MFIQIDVWFDAKDRNKIKRREKKKKRKKMHIFNIQQIPMNVKLIECEDRKSTAC